jgi:hypothetical protein
MFLNRKNHKHVKAIEDLTFSERSGAAPSTVSGKCGFDHPESAFCMFVAQGDLEHTIWANKPQEAI